jgi:hypothetical protein
MGNVVSAACAALGLGMTKINRSALNTRVISSSVSNPVASAAKRLTI